MEQHKLLVHGFEPEGVALGFRAKMTDAAFELEDFEFGAGQHSNKEMSGPHGQGFGG